MKRSTSLVPIAPLVIAFLLGLGFVGAFAIAVATSERTRVDEAVARLAAARAAGEAATTPCDLTLREARVRPEGALVLIRGGRCTLYPLPQEGR